MIQEFSLFFLKGTAFYFLSINLIYGALMILSWLKIKRFRLQSKKFKPDQSLPGVSFLIPAFNEQSLIVETIQTYLSLPFAQKEIIVINDGSHDQTFKLLQTMFLLKKNLDSELLYHSITHPELKVLEAPHTGKPMALNLGVEYAKFEIVCTMDADTIPEARGVETCLKAFALDQKLVAAGGVIQVLNSEVLKNNSPVQEKTAKWLPTFQRIEYLRAFICERLGWSLLGSTLLISGAFCMIKKAAIKRVGGFNHRSITEDLDLIVRLRREYKGENHHFKIFPVTTCYTQVPYTVRHLKLQRIRWQMGLVQTLSQNLGLVLHPGHGLLGLFAVPYFWLVEVLSPLMEGLALMIIPSALFQHWISPELVVGYLGLGLLFNVFITLMGVTLDQRYVSTTKNWSYFKTVIHSVLFHFGYKQITSWWRFVAIVRSFTEKGSWGEKPRAEITHQAL